MIPPKLVIFDCDGVLVDTEGATNDVLAASLSRYGPSIMPEECINRFVGGTMASVGAKARSEGYDLPDMWVDGLYAEMFDRLRQGVDLLPGIIDVLNQLDDLNVPYCVGSNGPMAKMEITLTPAGLWQRMQGRIFSPHVIGMQHAKPAPGLYLHTAQAMGTAPADAVVIEDSFSGASGAKAAGIRCFGYCATTSRERLVEAGAIPFDDMRALPRLLNLA